MPYNLIPCAYEWVSNECKCPGNSVADGGASSYLGRNTGGCTTCIWCNSLAINFISKLFSVIWVKSLSVNVETYAISGMVMTVPDTPGTLILYQLILIHLNIQQQMVATNKSVRLDIVLCEKLVEIESNI